MYKNILMILGLLLLSACSQNKPNPEVKTEVKEEVKMEVVTETAEEFIPEHLKHSKIEVVKHY